MGSRVEHRHLDVQLHQPHPAARSPREMADGPVQGVPTAAPGNHPRDQPLLLDARNAGHSDAGLLARVSLIAETDHRHGMVTSPYRPRRVNGVSALHTELMRKTVFRDLHGLSRPHRQRDQRHLVPPLALPGQPWPDRRHRRRRRAGSSTMPTRSGVRGAPRMPPCASALAVRRTTSSRWRDSSPIGSASFWTPMRCSTCRSSASTNTSGSC